jgi:hypothetical protein
LNNQFHSVCTKEDFDNLPSKGPSPHPTMPNIQVNSTGIKKLLKGLNIYKATGPDAIPTRFLHDNAEELAPIMTFIFQLSLDTGNKWNWLFKISAFAGVSLYRRPSVSFSGATPLESCFLCFMYHYSFFELFFVSPLKMSCK